MVIANSVSVAPDPSKAAAARALPSEKSNTPKIYPKDFLAYFDALTKGLGKSQDIDMWYTGWQLDRIRNTAVTGPGFWDYVLQTGSKGRNIFGEKVYPNYLTGTPMLPSIAGEASEAYTIFKSITVTTKSIPNFLVGIKLADFETNLAKLANAAWKLSADGKVKTLVYKGFTYVSRTFSIQGNSTVEILKDGQLLQKYRLLD